MTRVSCAPAREGTKAAEDWGEDSSLSASLRSTGHGQTCRVPQLDSTPEMASWNLRKVRLWTPSPTYFSQRCKIHLDHLAFLFTCGGAKQVYKSFFFMGPVCSTGAQKPEQTVIFNLQIFLLVTRLCVSWGRKISREFKFPGKSDFPRSQVSREAKFPGSQISL